MFVCFVLFFHSPEKKHVNLFTTDQNQAARLSADWQSWRGKALTLIFFKTTMFSNVKLCTMANNANVSRELESHWVDKIDGRKPGGMDDGEYL